MRLFSHPVYCLRTRFFSSLPFRNSDPGCKIKQECNSSAQGKCMPFLVVSCWPWISPRAVACSVGFDVVGNAPEADDLEDY